MISLIATVKNERKTIELWLAALLGQSRLPDEIVLVDGGSTDGTWEYLQQAKSQHDILVVHQQAGNISEGRNAAIRLAHGDIIVATDAGCTYDAEWFEQITGPLVSKTATWCATGFGPWLMPHDSLLVYMLAAATTPSEKEFATDWLPSSRSVAFTRDLWLCVGGYPEWIPICEDVIFDLSIQKKNAPIAYVRKALVRWRPRLAIGAYMRQLFRYTKSDGHGKLFFGRQMIRYAVYGGALIALFAAYMFSSALLVLLLALAGSVHMKKFWQRFVVFSHGKPVAFRLFGIVALPCILALGDIAKMAGWPVGVYERKTGKIRFASYS